MTAPALLLGRAMVALIGQLGLVLDDARFWADDRAWGLAPVPGGVEVSLDQKADGRFGWDVVWPDGTVTSSAALYLTPAAAKDDVWRCLSDKRDALIAAASAAL